MVGDPHIGVGGGTGTWQAGTERAVVCKHWLRGLCKKGDGCGFLHSYNVTKRPECYFHAKFGKCWTTGLGFYPPPRVLRAWPRAVTPMPPHVCGEKRLCHLAGATSPQAQPVRPTAPESPKL